MSQLVVMKAATAAHILETLISVSPSRDSSLKIKTLSCCLASNEYENYRACIE